MAPLNSLKDVLYRRVTNQEDTQLHLRKICYIQVIKAKNHFTENLPKHQSNL
jgi:hypothetical protein